MILWIRVKEQTELENMQNNLNKAREIYFKYFSSQKMAQTKATVCKWAMMGLPLVPSVRGKNAYQRQKREEASNRHQKAGKDVTQRCRQTCLMKMV